MRKFFLAAVLVLVAGGAQAATLNVVGGELFGASGVDVGGTLYDVEFLDGSCITLFTGCDNASDFTFQSLAVATLASQALLDQVFLDGPSGNFDSLPSLTNGCYITYGGCWTYTPYQLDGLTAAYVAYAFQDLIGPADGTGAWSIPGGLNTNTSGRDNFAVWSLVPEPSTALLLGLGLTGLSWSGGRRNRS